MSLMPEEAAFHAFYQREHAALEQACALHVAHLQELLAQAPGLEVAKVEGRVKDRDECLRKFARKYRAALEEAGTPYEIAPCITDLIGVRVVCLYEDELARVAQLVQAHYEVIDVTDRTGAAQAETSFGYKGLHLDLRLKPTPGSQPQTHAALPFELQVRTIIQDAWSVLDHRIKYKKSIPAELKRRINVLSALFELADREFRQIREATEAELRRVDDDAEAEAIGSRANPASATLNAFTFLRIAQHFFPEHAFDAARVDQFVQEIHDACPAMTRAQFNTLLRTTLAPVRRYRQFYETANPQGSFNAFTAMRHSLYLSDKVVFRRLLRNSARQAFEGWLQAQS
ncbi:ppGpp synthetase catalytic domain-containing protein (RelA/SpoT-type nucleotidyltranferase) [Oryzisolibacter propanilivorax]|uniref:PpGpp synthetase catalytic domain-containing protein (RelA/SpoT-type nucleotidyltranferase) n=1 Tax=Oryzisolibacter propanilivorax TaxID=1527607 RepID=A0A1G9PI68_9BURK|nr:RelA/SpoT domain-containing protein [Oryzisolibacter propanilivorax]SDL98536.1 ppGpp synthetase catalytic domain-containing protein (RelA/SpoT-type nucleotidyltranferase) [Oryzisolibacter propanilivorax]